MASLEGSTFSSDDAGCSSREDEEGFIKHIREYDNFRSFIDNDELKAEIETDFLRGLNRYISKHFKEWKDKEQLIVGVTGQSGLGKTSLINTLRGLKAEDEGAAAVDVMETTTSIDSYKYPKNNSIILRDFPGVGTKQFPKEEYLQKTKILDSSVVIIVCGTRFSENDFWLAKEVIAVQRNVLFVRSKIDVDLYNASLDYPVSSRHSKKYDILSLHEKIMGLLIMKAEAICHLLFEQMHKAIAGKTETIKTEFLRRKVASVVTGFFPIPKLESTIDQHHVKKIYECCQVKYCLDTDSITDFAREINMSGRKIESQMKSYDDKVRDENQLYTEMEDKKWNVLEKYSKYTFPVFGMIYSAYKSPRTMQACLDKICDVMADDELMLVKLRLRKLEEDLKS